jgi:hypothetical protein
VCVSTTLTFPAASVALARTVYEPPALRFATGNATLQLVVPVSAHPALPVTQNTSGTLVKEPAVGFQYRPLIAVFAVLTACTLTFTLLTPLPLSLEVPQMVLAEQPAAQSTSPYVVPELAMIDASAGDVIVAAGATLSTMKLTGALSPMLLAQSAWDAVTV